jgi:hypothetical protein
VAHGVRILECSRTLRLEVRAKRYENLSGALSRDNALEQQWPGSGSRDCEGLKRHNFFNTCPNGASEVCMVIYMKRL